MIIIAAKGNTEVKKTATDNIDPKDSTAGIYRSPAYKRTVRLFN